MSIIFYSWQSDLPNATNRGFIQKALENASKAIRHDESIEVEPVIDRDTSGVPGSPDIARTIFAKIEAAQVFVCDVSIINRESNARATPNPNVLVELGYALRALGEEKILMVMNSAYGEPELLPFDLKMKKVVKYYMSKESKNRATERRNLESRFEEELRTIYAYIAEQKKVLDLRDTETLILQCSWETLLEQNKIYVEPDEVYEKVKQYNVNREEFDESLEILGRIDK